MILFYTKEEVKNDDVVLVEKGGIFGVIDGRVHDERNLNAHITPPGLVPENMGKYIIGWIEKDGKRMGYNLDMFETLQRFEDISPESPFDYKVIDGVLIKK